jgi:hypothetical protein
MTSISSLATGGFAGGMLSFLAPCVLRSQHRRLGLQRVRSFSGPPNARPGRDFALGDHRPASQLTAFYAEGPRFTWPRAVAALAARARS